MEYMDNTIEKKFTTTGLIEQTYDVDTDTLVYWLFIRLNDCKKDIFLCECDTNCEKFTANKNIKSIVSNKLKYLHMLDQNSPDMFPLFVNVTGKYVFDINHPDNDHIEIEDILFHNSADVSVHRSSKYTGIITSVERHSEFVLLTMNGSNIKFTCPITKFKNFYKENPVMLYVDENMSPASSHHTYTVTDIEIL